MSVSLLNRDRVVDIVFARQGEQFHLVIELLGSGANLILTDGQGIIQNLYYPSPVPGNKGRILMQGIAYVSPEQKGFRPAAAQRESPRGDLS